MNETADFLVAGGGPAGATAAALLAKQGHRVCLVDRGTGPHHKVCGEFLSYEALGYLQAMGVNPWHLGAIPLQRVRLAAKDVIAETALPFLAGSLSRKTLDAALLRHAQDCGARLIGGRCIERLVPEAADWRLTLDDGQQLRGAQIMLATGKHDLRGHARGPGVHQGLVAFKLHWKLSAEQTRKLDDAVEVILFPGGYLGLQPTDGGAVNLCMVIQQESLRQMGGGWPRVLRHLKDSSRLLRERLTGAQECFARPLALSHIPYGYLCRETVANLWPLGDQAAVIPSFSGDGMAIALHSAHCAVAMHTAGKDATEYLGQIRRDVQSQMTQATRLSKVMVQRPYLTHLLRWFPALLSHFAQSTRISEDQLLDASSFTSQDAQP